MGSQEKEERNSENRCRQFLYLLISRKSFAVTSAPLDKWTLHEITGIFCKNMCLVACSLLKPHLS